MFADFLYVPGISLNLPTTFYSQKKKQPSIVLHILA